MQSRAVVVGVVVAQHLEMENEIVARVACGMQS